MKSRAKPVVLVLVGRYLPGFKAGGIISCVANIVNHLHGEFDFRIVTRDRDLGSDSAYGNIRPCVWQKIGNALVYYLPPEAESFGHVRHIVNETPHDLLYLNSFFEPINIKALFNRRLGLLTKAPVLLAPHGEFAWPSLKQKFPKKLVFMRVARLLRLYDSVNWHASNDVEAADVMKFMRVLPKRVHVAHQLPPVVEDEPAGLASDPSERPADDTLRLYFFARISPEKNLDYALKVLCRVRTNVALDIIGPIENVAYWNECQTLIRQLPVNVTARSVGAVPPAKLMETLRQYDLLLFPSGGEGYGQVIAESLINGTRVLISNETPWRDLSARGLGWDLPLDNLNAFVHVIDGIGPQTAGMRVNQRKLVKDNMKKYIASSSAIRDIKRLLENMTGQSDKR